MPRLSLTYSRLLGFGTQALLGVGSAAWLGLSGIAFADEGHEVPSEDSSEAFQASVGLGFSSRAEYEYEPSERSFLQGNVSYRYGFHNFGFRQRLNYRHDSVRSGGEKNGPSEEYYFSNPDLIYSLDKNLVPSLDRYDLKLLASATGDLGLSKQSTTEDHYKGSISANLALPWESSSILELTPSLGATRYFFDETFSEDGSANSSYSLSTGLSARIKYKSLTVSQSVTFYETVLYEGWEPTYDFASVSTLGYTVNQQWSLTLSLATKDNQLRYGRNKNFKAYDKDITRFTIELVTKL